MERSASASSSVGPITNGDGASVTLWAVGESVACTSVSPPVPLRSAGEPATICWWALGAVPRDAVVSPTSPDVVRIPAAGAVRLPTSPNVAVVLPREVDGFRPLSPSPVLLCDGRPQGQHREHPPLHPIRVQIPAKHCLVHPHQQHEAFRPRRCSEGLL